ncbi:MAG: hypothetical protein A3G75_08270 [Verrucomicrobia bacterium RIFCSPLOWO2_12_FULL_64_8]|nr:MAG: hypothetical protein A3G75_08270 [Verrucomicrobia bacterium RIFCSPLOWO2_12_FULL_64_8]
MNPPSQASFATPALIHHHFDELFDVQIPLPALQRGWLHGRELTLAWKVDRIIERIGEGCWFSHYCRDHHDAETDGVKLRPYAIAGFWPSGGFVELRLRHANPLEERPRSVLAVYAESPARAGDLMTEFITHYRQEASVIASEARIGMLN